MINEALLEMHFHKSMVDLFASTFGKKFLRLLKPSQQHERWVGFDQGWINTSISMEEFFTALKEKIKASDTFYDKLYLAYFFQFKPVEKITRNSKHKPPSYGTPYYRTQLDLTPNKTTGISQHETLQRLSAIANTEVNYACAMLFEPDDIYEEVDISKLRLVPINTAPTGWLTNQKHFIMFETETDPNPKWCSKPVDGLSYAITEILERGNLRLLTGEELLRLIATINTVLNDAIIDKNFLTRDKRIEGYYPNSFSILEFENNGS